MPNMIKIYLGALGAIGAIELEVPGFNDLYPINANIAPNARGRRVERGEYMLDSIAYTPKTQEVQTAYGKAIIRFVGENENKMAIFGGETAPNGDLLPTEGSSIRVSNEVLERVVSYIEERESGTELIVTDGEPGLINKLRINNWYGQPANTERIGLIRPERFRGEPIEQTIYTESDLSYSDTDDWFMWELLYYMDDEAASQTDFYQTYDEEVTGCESGASCDPDTLLPDGCDQSEEAPYIADPFVDIEQRNLTFENQSESPDDGDTYDSTGVDDAPDNNY
jgi:hypothetical protein